MVRRIAVTSQQQRRGAAYRTLRCIQRTARTEYCFLNGKSSVPVHSGPCPAAARIEGSRISAAIQRQAGIAADGGCSGGAVAAAIDSPGKDGVTGGGNADAGIASYRIRPGTSRIGTAHDALDKAAGGRSQINRHIGASGNGGTG